MSSDEEELSYSGGQVMGGLGDMISEGGESVTSRLNGDWGKARKMADCDMSGQRQRKISHRKVIIHDDGEICNKTYNKVRTVLEY